MKKKVLIGIIVLVGLIIVGIGWYFTSHAPVLSEKTILENFIRENLKEEYLPKELNVVHKLTYNNRTDGLDTLYGAIWYVGDTKFYTSFHKNINKTGISNLEIFIFAPEITNELNEDKASALFSKYFSIKTQDKIICNSPTQNVTYCERFWIEENKDKIGMVVVSTSNNKFIAICKYPVGSEEYELSSCVK
jgi:hypothetical protein